MYTMFGHVPHKLVLVLSFFHEQSLPPVSSLEGFMAAPSYKRTVNVGIQAPANGDLAGTISKYSKFIISMRSHDLTRLYCP